MIDVNHPTRDLVIEAMQKDGCAMGQVRAGVNEGLRSTGTESSAPNA